MVVAVRALSPGGDTGARMRTCCPLRFLVGVGVCMFSSVALGIWGGRESSCRSRTADWAWFFSSCFLSHFKTEFDVSIGENSGLLVWVFNFLKNFIYISILKWKEWQGNSLFKRWNTPLRFCIPMNRDCRCIKPKGTKFTATKRLLLRSKKGSVLERKANGSHLTRYLLHYWKRCLKNHSLGPWWNL